MLLVSDIGNTNITLGLYDNDKFIDEFRLASDIDLSYEEYSTLLKSIFKPYNIDGCIISSVVDELSDKFISAVKNTFQINPLFLDEKTDTGVKIVIDNPSEMGADRIANAVAAVNLFSSPVIVIDLGTATTFDVINENNEFIGGIIALGINLQLKTLNKFTSKLPKIDVAYSKCALATNTEDAILAGVIRGCACMIDGLIEQCEEELGKKATIVATGGYSKYVSKYLKRPFDFVCPTLTLDGLKMIYDKVKQNKGRNF